MPDEKYKDLWEDIWARVCEYKQTDDKQVNAFFSRLQPQAFSEGFLMLTADTDFIKDWVETNYLHFIQQALTEKYEIPFAVAIEVDPNSSYSPALSQTTQPVEKSQTDNEQPQIQSTSQHKQTAASELVSEYSFDNFVVGFSNQLAYSMAVSVAENPGSEQLNPLFIYGKSGLGKTHLLRAIQNYVGTNYPQMKTVYIDAIEFVNDYTEAGIKGGGQKFNEFKEQYIEADLVLIDDVQSLQGKAGSMNIVFQIYKQLTDHGKQMVFAADRSAQHIDMDERYRSRFLDGGVCDIQPPETETKLGIIKNYIKECKTKGNLSFDISPEVQDYIAENSGSNIRELKSAITKVIFYGHNLGKDSVSVEEVIQILKDHFNGGPTKPHTIANIQKAVEQYYSISHTDLVGKKRNAYIAHARQVAIYLCRNMIDIPYAAIGKEFGGKDHTTIMYSVNHIEQMAKENREVYEELEIIQQIIKDQ